MKPDAVRDTFVYKPDNLHLYGQDFLSHIDPQFAQDIETNYDWYMENQNEILLDVGYPSKQEKEFLKHIE